jgi:hypothetical protein
MDNQTFSEQMLKYQPIKKSAGIKWLSSLFILLLL